MLSMRCLLSIAALSSAVAQFCAQTRQLAGSRNGTTTAMGNADGVGTNALLNNPYDAVLHPNGTGIYFSEQQGCRIRFYTFSTGVVSPVVGWSNNTCGQADGVGTNAQLAGPNGLALDPIRNVLYTGLYYSAQTPGTYIRRIDLQTLAVTKVIGNSTLNWNVDGVGTSSSFSMVRGVAIDAVNNLLYLADYNPPCALRMVNLSASPPFSRQISGAAYPCTSADGVGTSIMFNAPSGLRFDSSAGVLWVAESSGGRFRRLTFSSPGVLASSSTILPNGIPLASGWARNFFFDGAGNIILPQYSATVSALYSINPNTSAMTVIAGNPADATASSVDGVGTTAHFYGIISGAYDTSTATIYLTEQVVHKLRVVSMYNCSTTPSSTSAPTVSNTPTPASTPSQTPTYSPTMTSSLSVGVSASITPTLTDSPSATFSMSLSPTASSAPTLSPTAAVTPSITPTVAATPSSSPTATLSPGAAASVTATSSLSTGSTPSSSATASPSAGSLSATVSSGPGGSNIGAVSSGNSAVIGGAAGGAAVLAIAAAVTFLFMRRRRRSSAATALAGGHKSTAAPKSSGGGDSSSVMSPLAAPRPAVAGSFRAPQAAVAAGAKDVPAMSTRNNATAARAPAAAPAPAPAPPMGLAQAAEGLPPGWEPIFSRSKNTYYYRHKTSQETSWVKPTMSGASATSAAVPPAAGDAEANLPPGWAAVWSKSKSVYYWRNASTGATSWTKPTA